MSVLVLEHDHDTRETTKTYTLTIDHVALERT